MIQMLLFTVIKIRKVSYFVFVYLQHVRLETSTEREGDFPSETIICCYDYRLSTLSSASYYHTAIVN